MYKRKIDSYLSDWKKKSNHKPLVIKGCRQCGKTSSVKDEFKVYMADTGLFVSML